MKEITQQYLINAFGGESMAHMRYLHFANQAEKENFPNVVRLFRGISHAEYVHAGDHYQELDHLDGVPFPPSLSRSSKRKGYRASSGLCGRPRLGPPVA